MRTRLTVAEADELGAALEPRETTSEFLRSAIRTELERRAEAQEEPAAAGPLAALDELFARVKST